jgi:hypothetical protein
LTFGIIFCYDTFSTILLTFSNKFPVSKEV